MCICVHSHPLVHTEQWMVSIWSWYHLDEQWVVQFIFFWPKVIIPLQEMSADNGNVNERALASHMVSADHHLFALSVSIALKNP